MEKPAPKGFRQQAIFWFPIVILTLLIGYATNALISVAWLLMDRLVELPQWIVWNGGLASLVSVMGVSSVWLAKTLVAKTRFSRGLKLTGSIFLLVVPPFLTLPIVDGPITTLAPMASLALPH
jgi:hypothetical protein